MIEVVPAIIPKNLQDLEAHLEKVRGLALAAQIDVLDGKLVAGEISWPFREAQIFADDFREIARGDKDLPFKDEFYFEVDLMISEPERSIEDFLCAGFSRAVVHIESTKHMGECIEKARAMDADIGIAIGIDTPTALLEEWIERIDFVQCMGIAEIGTQGQPFDRRAVEKIAQVSGLRGDILISVDGGVSPKTAPLLLGAGAERLVSGSAIFGSEDTAKAFEEFYKLAEAPEEGRYEI